MKDALKEMNCRREKLGITYKDIATKVQKDPSLVMRQFSEDANPTLDTLEAYASYLGGSIHFLPAEWENKITDNEKLHQRIGALSNEIEMLSDRIAKQDVLLAMRLQRIDELQDLLTEVVHKLMEKI